VDILDKQSEIIDNNIDRQDLEIKKKDIIRIVNEKLFDI
jgi:hypothetical protein